MPNLLFNALGGNSMGNMGQLFQRLQMLKSQFKGDPKQEVERLVQSGKISQQQLIELQRQAEQIQAMMHQFK